MSKPPSSVVVPRQSPRLALAVAMALVGFALTGTHAFAQGAGASFGTCATSGDLCTSLGRVMAASLCWAAACVAFAGWISLRKPGPCHINPIMQACVLLAAFAAVGAGALVAVASPILIGSASSVPGDAGQLVRFQ